MGIAAIIISIAAIVSMLKELKEDEKNFKQSI